MSLDFDVVGTWPTIDPHRHHHYCWSSDFFPPSNVRRIDEHSALIEINLWIAFHLYVVAGYCSVSIAVLSEDNAIQ